MSFNPDSSKQAQKIKFSREKWSHHTHLNVYFNIIPVSSTSVHNYLGILLDDKLSYEHNLKFVLKKVSKAVNLLREFQQDLLRQSLITIYKLFILPHLDYGDIVYDWVFHKSFHKKLESIQYNAAIAITGALKGTFSEKFFSRIRIRILKIETLVKKIMFVLQLPHIFFS